ncbi:MAG TPA: hypothetical protein VLE53_02815 [Gemmatimonadaceae bacterium]|nr:hypothetical protein [Gemmatimonadaceae bacterium]
MNRVAPSRPGLVAGALFTILAAWGCSSPTSSCGDVHPSLGEWSYQATRESGVHGTISGSLVIESRDCTDLHGVIDVVEVLATGESRRLAGPVSGTVVDSTLVRFEAVLGLERREHLARITGDSIAGNWVEISGGAAGSGPFGGRRQEAR